MGFWLPALSDLSSGQQFNLLVSCLLFSWYRFVRYVVLHKITHNFAQGGFWFSHGARNIVKESSAHFRSLNKNCVLDVCMFFFYVLAIIVITTVLKTHTAWPVWKCLTTANNNNTTKNKMKHKKVTAIRHPRMMKWGRIQLQQCQMQATRGTHEQLISVLLT